MCDVTQVGEEMKANSKIIAQCTLCGIRYEAVVMVKKPICYECQPLKRCTHGVPTLKECADCFKVTGKAWMRVGVK